MEDPTYSAIGDRDAAWTDQETLLLLEGLELFNDDWNAIADHVGTKTREQCVIRFLQLPIEEGYNDENPESKDDLGPLKYNKVPFSQADNPVMSVVAFLASIVDPKVAAAAARSSIEEMTKNLSLSVQEKPNTTSTDKPTTDSSAAQQTPPVKAETEPASGSMDVDTPATPASSTSSPLSQAASIALGTAAARASALASHEEREMTKLVNGIVNISLKKMDLKLRQFEELEAVLQAERREVEKARQGLFLERLEWKRRLVAGREQLLRAVETGGQEGRQLVEGVVRGVQGGSGTSFEGLEQSRREGMVVRPPSAEQGYVPFEA